MLVFSETGLHELRTKLLEAKPYIGLDSYDQLWSMISSIGSDRAVTQDDYDHILHLLEPYSRQHGVDGVANLPREEEKPKAVAEFPLVQAEEVVFALRYFLLSYSGIENFESATEGHFHIEMHGKGRENCYG